MNMIYSEKGKMQNTYQTLTKTLIPQHKFL